jgi:hypothetical protein
VPSEHVEEQLAGCTAQSSGLGARSDHKSFCCSCTLEFESGPIKPSTEETARSANVVPQSAFQIGREDAGLETVGSAEVFVMHEELVETGK